MAAIGFAAETPKKQFDLPEELAEQSLKRLAAQSGREVLFPPDAVEGVVTRAVKGEMTPLAALDAMLTGTVLVGVQHEQTGSLTVRREKPVSDTKKSGARPAPAMESDRPAAAKKKSPDSFEEPTKTMKPKSPVSWLAGLFAFVAGPASLSAQATSPNESGPDRVVELSPFVVSTSKDTGYQAMSTLAGTRLDTPLKDIGAAVSVYTKDFLDDIGATDSGDFLIYATNMEAAGTGGNFAGARDVDANIVFSFEAREDPQGTSRSRGLAAPTFTRDFFVNLIPIDSYNTDRVTVLRGPNSALFGVSSPAGVTDTALARADVGRNKNKIAFRYGNNDSKRGTVDFNRVLIQDKLAVRLIGLESREEYNQRPAFEAKERIYGALTYRPFNTASFRANFESGRMRANRPFSILPNNGIAEEWYANGRPGFDWTAYDDPARNPLAASQNAGNFLPYYMTAAPGFGQLALIYNNPDDQAISTIMRARTPSTPGTVADAIKNQLFHPTLNRDLAADTVMFVSTNHIQAMAPAAYWVGENVLPGQLPGFAPAGLKQQGFTDFSAFDWKNRMIDETARYGDNFHSSNFAFEQRGWGNRVGIELAYDRQRLDRRSRATFFSWNNGGTLPIRIDTTVTMPDGRPNPNLGRPYASQQAGARWNNLFVRSETVRASPYIKFDFKDLNNSWGKWTGRHTLNGVVERFRTDQINAVATPRVDGEVAQRVSSVPDNSRAPGYVVYLGPSLIGNNNPLKLNPIRVNVPMSGPIGNISAFTRAADTTDVGGFVDSPASIIQTVHAGQVKREVIESTAATLQSYWLEDHVVTMFGWRRDTDYAVQENIAFTPNPDNLNDPGKVIYGFNDLTFPSTPPLNVAKDVVSYSVVLRWPRKLINLPRGTDFSVFYNNAENFTPSAGRIEGFGGQPIPEPQGKSREYGFNLSAFDNRLVLRANWFETSAVNVSGAQNGANALPYQRYVAWAAEGNNNPHLMALRQSHMDKLMAPLPANYLQLYNVAVTGTSPNIQASAASGLAGQTDTLDYVATGTEVELTYNPTPNWRILANLARQQTVKTNQAPHAKQHMALMAPVYAELANVPAGNYPIGWQIGDPLPATTETLGAFIDRTLGAQLAGIWATDGFPSPEQREWRFNLVSNYSFGKGSIFGDKLRGWSVGGGLRWQSKFIMGFPSSRNPDATINFDMTRPYYAPAETNVDGFVSYQRKIWDNRVNWKVQLNVTNLYKPRDLIPIGMQPWGQISSVRLAPERRWYLTNTFSF